MRQRFTVTKTVGLMDMPKAYQNGYRAAAARLRELNKQYAENTKHLERKICFLEQSLANEMDKSKIIAESVDAKVKDKTNYVSCLINTLKTLQVVNFEPVQSPFDGATYTDALTYAMHLAENAVELCPPKNNNASQIGDEP